MKNIDLGELQRVLKIKGDYDKGLINIDMIDPKDYEIINLLYNAEIDKKNIEIEKLKSEINEIYTMMKEMIDEAEKNGKVEQ